MCPWPRTVCESAGGRWRDGAGDFRTLGIRSHRCLHTGWRGAGRRGRLFRPPRSGGGSVPVAAHSLRECRGAMARRGGPLPYLVYPVLARMLACKVDYTEIRLSRNDDGAVPVAAHSLRECQGAIVRRRILFAYLGCPVTRMHVCGGGRDPIFGFRETVIGRQNSHLETLRRTQEVLNCPQNTGLQAYT